MNELQDDYNTSRELMTISEYGRHIQEYVHHLQSIADRGERTRFAHALIAVMGTLNPEVKLQSNYKEKLWGHLQQIADYALDVDCEYELPTEEERTLKPKQIGYAETNIKFRFYGRNLQNMVDRLATMDDSEVKQEILNTVASFMYNSCRNWNNENLSKEVIAEHMNVLSKGKLTLSADEFEITQDQNFQRKFFQRSGGKNNNNKGGGPRNNKGGGKNNNNNNNRKGNFRRY